MDPHTIASAIQTFVTFLGFVGSAIKYFLEKRPQTVDVQVKPIAVDVKGKIDININFNAPTELETALQEAIVESDSPNQSTSEFWGRLIYELVVQQESRLSQLIALGVTDETIGLEALSRSRLTAMSNVAAHYIKASARELGTQALQALQAPSSLFGQTLSLIVRDTSETGAPERQARLNQIGGPTKVN